MTEDCPAFCHCCGTQSWKVGWSLQVDAVTCANVACSMALEDYIRETRALIKTFRDHADTLEKQLQTTLSLLSAEVLKGGKLDEKKPDAWKVADDIQRILEDGAKHMLRDELTKLLVERDLVGGADRNTKFSAARRAITNGLNKGYLRLKGETVHWVPNVYQNSRLPKNNN